MALPIVPLTILGIAGVQAAAQFFQGKAQRKKARQISASEPSFQTQAATESAVREASTTTLTGEDQIKQDLEQSVAQAIVNAEKSATSGDDTLGVVASATASMIKALRKVGINRAKEALGNRSIARRAQQFEGQIRDQNRREAEGYVQQYLLSSDQNYYNSLNSLLSGVGYAAIEGFGSDTSESNKKTLGPNVGNQGNQYGGMNPNNPNVRFGG